MSAPSTTNWNYSFIKSFIDTYKSLPCLWDKKNKNYFDNALKNQAYALFVNKLRHKNPEVTRELVVRKINNLRCCYRKEFKKVQASKQRGDEEIYEPNLWYFHRLDFLYNNENQNNDEKLEAMEGEDCDSQDVKLEFCSVNEGDDDTNSYEIDRASPIYLQSNQENTVSTNHETVQAHPTQKSDFLAGSKNDTSLPSASSHGLNDTHTLLEPNLHGSVNSVASSNQQRCTVPIAASVYGKFGAYIADELTVMQPHVSAVCQKLINDVIFEAKCGTISRDSRIVT